jgi:LEA14-like dessication related protein
MSGKYVMKFMQQHSPMFVLALLIVPVIIIGCAKPGRRLEPPRVNLAHIQVQEIKLFETVLKIELRVFNTNEVALNVNGIDCKLELNGEKVASGVSDTKTKIPAFGSALVPMMLYSSFIDFFQGVMKSRGTKEMKYTVKGRVHMTGGFLLPPMVPFETKGAIPIDITEDSP